MSDDAQMAVETCESIFIIKGLSETAAAAAAKGFLPYATKWGLKLGKNRERDIWFMQKYVEKTMLMLNGKVVDA